MKSKYRNIFFVFGLVAIGLMLWKFDPDFGGTLSLLAIGSLQ